MLEGHLRDAMIPKERLVYLAKLCTWGASWGHHDPEERLVHSIKLYAWWTRKLIGSSLEKPPILVCIDVYCLHLFAPYCVYYSCLLYVTCLLLGFSSMFLTMHGMLDSWSACYIVICLNLLNCCKCVYCLMYCLISLYVIIFLDTSCGFGFLEYFLCEVRFAM